MNIHTQVRCPECKDRFFILQKRETYTRGFCFSCEHKIEKVPRELEELLMKGLNKERTA